MTSKTYGEIDLKTGTVKAPLPTIGRIVHFYTSDTTRMSNGMGAGPYPAMVTQVFQGSPDHDTMANLKVFPPMGEPYDAGSVQEKAQADANGHVGRYWVWPPRD